MSQSRIDALRPIIDAKSAEFIEAHLALIARQYEARFSDFESRLSRQAARISQLEAQLSAQSSQTTQDQTTPADELKLTKASLIRFMRAQGYL